MKVAMHNWMRQEPIETTLERLAKYGYQGIEISGEPEQYDTGQIQELLDKYGIACWGAVTLMTEGRDLLSNDSQVRRTSTDYCNACVNFVADLGGKILTLIPGTVGKIVPSDSPSNEWKWAVEALKEIGQLAGERGVMIGIEPLNRFETYFINRHDQALALASDVGLDSIGVCLDAFHINIEEADPMGAIRATGSKLVDFHVADNNRMPAGMGRYDWGEVIRTLQEAGYDEYVTSEFVIPNDRTPCATELTRMGTADESGYDADMEKFLRDHGTGAIGAKQYDEAVEYTMNTLKQYL